MLWLYGKISQHMDNICHVRQLPTSFGGAKGDPSDPVLRLFKSASAAPNELCESFVLLFFFPNTGINAILPMSKPLVYVRRLVEWGLHYEEGCRASDATRNVTTLVKARLYTLSLEGTS